MKNKIMNKDLFEPQNSVSLVGAVVSVPLTAVFLSVEDKQQQFQMELKALLIKFKAELAIEDFDDDWSDQKIVVDFDWDQDLCDRTDKGSVPQCVIGRLENGR
jgi:hypothetical protein